MSLISMDTELLGEQADALNGIIGQIEAIFGNEGSLDKLTGEIVENWSGASCDAFATQYSDLKPAFMQTIDLLNTVHSQILASIDSTIDNDTGAASMYGVQ